jgi:hypothetical protein
VTPVNLCNLALAEMGSRKFINSFSDTTAEAIVANIFWPSKIQMMLRAANWDFARAQATLTLYKQAILSTGEPSPTPPPQPFLFEYIYPTDCLKVRFVLPTVNVTGVTPPLTTAPGVVPFVGPAPTAIPFVIGTDKDAQGNPIKVLLTNLPAAQCIYTRDLSGYPDQWDMLFTSGATALLGAYFINALARNAAQYQAAVAMSKSIIDEARMANGNEAINDIDREASWVRARRTGGNPWGTHYGATAAWGVGGGWNQIEFPDGLRY